RSVENAMSLNASEAEAEAVKLESLADSGDYTADQESHMIQEANLIRLVGDWTRADAARRETALLEATRIFERGYLENRILNSKKREEIARKRTTLRKETKSEGTRQQRKAKASKDEKKKLGRAKT